MIVLLRTNLLIIVLILWILLYYILIAPRISIPTLRNVPFSVLITFRPRASHPRSFPADLFPFCCPPSAR